MKKNSKTITGKKNATENKDTNEEKNVKKKNTENKGGEENKEIRKKDKEGKNKPNRNNSPREKSKIYILGDSIINKSNGYFLMGKVRHKSLIKVRSFSGAKDSCMDDQVKPALRDDKSDSKKTASQTAKSIMDLTTSFKKKWQFGNCVWHRTLF